MKDFEWRKKYAPHGYRYTKARIPFETLERAVLPSVVLTNELEHLRHKLETEVDGRFQPTVFTRVTIYPKDIGESLGHLDPLRPRFGIEIELRQPAPAPAAAA